MPIIQGGANIVPTIAIVTVSVDRGLKTISGKDITLEVTAVKVP